MSYSYPAGRILIETGNVVVEHKDGDKLMNYIHSAICKEKDLYSGTKNINYQNYEINNLADKFDRIIEETLSE